MFVTIGKIVGGAALIGFGIFFISAVVTFSPHLKWIEDMFGGTTNVRKAILILASSMIGAGCYLIVSVFI